ncbi:two-component system VirA-like sensor kinase [Methyloferula stellata]|uniref:two-component system VirA-like sensor kinase n=1 Tax=Methyloferula stellata TaxID=876270 RepID=UPI00039A58FB|nr:two-component system VirA-like sensor kinase [Methyloferula stellata]
MRIAPVFVVVPLLILLLTWLSLRSANLDAELFDHALGELDRFGMVEAGLDRDVLNARAGLLRNYDPLVNDVQSLYASLARLRETVAGDAQMLKVIDQLTLSVHRQEDLVEQFKSGNALLRNSLAYFSLFSDRLVPADQVESLTPGVGALVAAMLRLTLDTSSGTALAVQDRLDELARQPVSPGDTDAVQALLAHGRLLHTLLPATDKVLKSLCGAQDKANRELVRTMILARQVASRSTASRFRIVLYVTSLTLVAALVYLVLQVRARARVLQRRAAFEHALAGISLRFLRAPQNLDANIDQALAEMAEAVRADRAYFVLSGASPRLHKWCKPGESFPPDWPQSALYLATKSNRNRDGVIYLPNVKRLAPKPESDAYAAFGVKGLAWALGSTSNGSDALLGFEVVLHPYNIKPSDEHGLWRMALTIIVNAIEQNFAEAEKARLEMRLQQARRMETLGAFASGIAHNFNNIVGAILGFAEMAQAQVEADSRPGRNVVAIHKSAERARDLVDQILAFGRRRDTRRGRVNVQSVIGEAEILLNASLPQGIELVIHEVPEAAVSGEAAQLQQVILNLCGNAAQAMDGSGRVEVETHIDEIVRTRSLSHGDLRPGSYVCIAISDAGCGMDEATLDRIFEPFFTMRLDGNGLGLATVREIVREYGGAMNVESTPGKGSRFEAWLPCLTGAEPRAVEEMPVLPLGRGETVLMVEANVEQLLRNEEVLAALGYEPIGFSSAEDALASCRMAPGRFDAFVISHLAPAKAALELADALHKLAPDQPIVLATAAAEEIDARTMLSIGISEVVRRPLVAAELATALARTLAPDFPDRRRAANS